MQEEMSVRKEKEIKAAQAALPVQAAVVGLRLPTRLQAEHVGEEGERVDVLHVGLKLLRVAGAVQVSADRDEGLAASRWEVAK